MNEFNKILTSNSVGNNIISVEYLKNNILSGLELHPNISISFQQIKVTGS